jgi:hypothetical protein
MHAGVDVRETVGGRNAMPDWNVRRVVTIAAGLLLAASVGGTDRRDADEARAEAPAVIVLAAAPAHCCFTNPRYVGTCDVAPAADETCAAILSYLNNPQSQGRTYCGSTSIRGDWKAASCETKPSGD